MLRASEIADRKDKRRDAMVNDGLGITNERRVRLARNGCDVLLGIVNRNAAGRLARDLWGGDIETVPDIDRGYFDQQRRQRRLIVAAGGLVPNRFRNRIRLIGD